MLGAENGEDTQSDEDNSTYNMAGQRNHPSMGQVSSEQFDINQPLLEKFKSGKVNDSDG